MKRGRGRPKKEKPWEYWDDLSSLRVFAKADRRGIQKTKIEKMDGEPVKFRTANSLSLRTVFSFGTRARKLSPTTAL